MRMALVLCASSFTTEMQETQIPIKESFHKDDEQEGSEWDDRKKITQLYK